MNRVFRVVFNEVRGTWVAVSEMAKSAGKKASTASILPPPPIDNHSHLVANVSGSLKKGFVGLAPLCVALMGVFFVPVAWGEVVNCEYDRKKGMYCGTDNEITNSNFGAASSATFGFKNKISGTALTYGYDNTLTNSTSQMIFGYGNQVRGTKNSVFGIDNIVSGSARDLDHGGTAVFGSGNTAQGGTVIGKLNTIKADTAYANHDSTAVGYGNEISKNGDTSVFGYKNQVAAAALVAGKENTVTSDNYSNTTVVGSANNVASGDVFGRNNTVAAAAVFGRNNTATATGNVIGYHNELTGHGYDNNDNVFGSQNKVVAEGEGSSITKNYGSANVFGWHNTVTYSGNAFGKSNTVAGHLSSAFGYANKVEGDISHTSIAVGNQNTVKDTVLNSLYHYSFAAGSYNVSGNGAQVFGSQNNGYGFSDESEDKPQLGEGVIVLGIENNNLAREKIGTNSVTVGMKNHVAAERSFAFGYGNKVFGNDEYLYVPIGSMALGQYNIIKGAGYAVGYDNEIQEGTKQATIVGYENIAHGGKNNIIIGSDSEAWGEENVVIGDSSAVANHYATVLGSRSIAMAEGSIALGDTSVAERKKGEIGYLFDENKHDEHSGVWKSTSGVLSIGNPDNKNYITGHGGMVTRQITGVAAGSEDTDAVNVAQLKELASQIGNGNSGNNNNTTTAPSLTVAAGNNNIQVKTANNTATVSLNNKISVDSVTVGTVSINNDGKISGVAAGAAEKDAVNFGQLKALSDTVSNLQDTVDNLTPTNPNNNNPQPVATAITVTGNSGSGKVTNKAQIVGDGSNVKTTVSGSQVSIALGDDIAVKTVTADKLSAGQTTLSATGLNNGGNVISNVKAGSADLEAVNVKQLKDANAANLKASVQAVKGDNKNITTQAGDKEVQVALNNDISLNSVTAADKITVGSLTVNQNGKITGVVSDINDDSTAVNVGLLKEELKKGGNYRPITVAGDTGSFEVDNGGRANWVGDGQNITTAANGDTVKIELNKNIKVDSVTAGSTVVNNDGVKVGNNGVALTPNGLNNGGQVISNVAAGVRPTDAVNVSQLNNAVGGVYGRRIDSVEKHANAGTAQALAAANMPTASQPGEGMLSISGGVYRGEQGYAIGYSQLSENGRWVIRATGSGNSRSHFGGAVGVGFKLF